jgi:hypothetical protein
LYENPHAIAAISKAPTNAFSTTFGTRNNRTRHPYMLGLETLPIKAGNVAATLNRDGLAKSQQERSPSETCSWLAIAACCLVDGRSCDQANFTKRLKSIYPGPRRSAGAVSGEEMTSGLLCGSWPKCQRLFGESSVFSRDYRLSWCGRIFLPSLAIDGLTASPPARARASGATPRYYLRDSSSLRRRSIRGRRFASVSSVR